MIMEMKRGSRKSMTTIVRQTVVETMLTTMTIIMTHTAMTIIVTAVMMTIESVRWR